MRAMVRRNARPLTWFMTLAMLSEAIEMAIPVGIGLVIDHGIFKANLWLTVGGAVGLAALRLLANLCWASFFEPIMEIRAREQHNLRLAVTAAALDRSIAPQGKSFQSRPRMLIALPMSST